MSKTTLHSLTCLKKAGEKATCITSYDASFTQRANQAGVDIILVGDS